MRIDQATTDDAAGLAELLFLMAADEERARQTIDTFAEGLARWWSTTRQSHFAFVARADRIAQPGEPAIIGMAWVALVPRIPRPGSSGRLSADIQSVFVLPEHRGQGIASALVEAASQHATHLGSTRITVHSSLRAVPMYERLGFGSSRELLQRPPDPRPPD